MTQILKGLAWALAALTFGAAGAVLIVGASLLGLAIDYGVTIAFYFLVGITKGVWWLVRPKG